MSLALYIASLLGAISLVLIMPKSRGNLPRLGSLLGAATLGGLWLYLARFLPASLGLEHSAMAFYYIFSAIAIFAAVRVITHSKPVYAALWFVMVVLASAGLFLTLDAQFIAFAMIIIYGGAILVTYMFVIMLASQSTADDAPQSQPEYDRFSREPVLAVTAGFLLLALLLNITFRPIAPNPEARGLSDQIILRGGTTPQGNYVAPILGRRSDLRRTEQKALQTAGVTARENMGTSLGAGQHVTDIERIGLDLFRGHPLGLELAGVILLVSLVGAVVIAKTHVPGEDDVLSPAEQRALQARTRPIPSESSTKPEPQP